MSRCAPRSRTTWNCAQTCSSRAIGWPDMTCNRHGHGPTSAYLYARIETTAVFGKQRTCRQRAPAVRHIEKHCASLFIVHPMRHDQAFCGVSGVFFGKLHWCPHACSIGKRSGLSSSDACFLVAERPTQESDVPILRERVGDAVDRHHDEHQQARDDRLDKSGPHCWACGKREPMASFLVCLSMFHMRGTGA
jgi:hypothetical protein